MNSSQVHTCKLCGKEADKTGSHIFTSSLIASCINQPQKKGRDKEFMFGFGQDGTTDTFFGRDILPEKIADVLGSSVESLDLKDNATEIVADYIFCDTCEKLFSVVESKFSPQIQKIKLSNLQVIQDGGLARLYFLIQIFRASVVKYNDWALDSNFEEELRKIVLDGCEKIKTNVTLDLSHLVFQVPMLISYLETDTDPSSNHIVIPNFKNPTVFFLCDFVVQFFENNDNKIGRNIEAYNLNDKRTPNDFLLSGQPIPIHRLSNSDRECLNDNLIRLDLAPKFVKSHQKKFLFECLKTGHLPTNNRMKKFISLMFVENSDSLILGDEKFKASATQAITSTF